MFLPRTTNGIVKDSVFYPSGPYRHMAELVGLAKVNFDDHVVPPVMLFYHDGGPDHRLKYYSVMMSESALNSCNSIISAIRSTATSNPSIKDDVSKSLVPLFSLIGIRFGGSLKENSFQIGKPATDYEIKCLWSFIDMIDSELSMSNTTKKDVC